LLLKIYKSIGKEVMRLFKGGILGKGKVILKRRF